VERNNQNLTQVKLLWFISQCRVINLLSWFLRKCSLLLQGHWMRFGCCWSGLEEIMFEGCKDCGRWQPQKEKTSRSCTRPVGTGSLKLDTQGNKQPFSVPQTLRNVKMVGTFHVWGSSMLCDWRVPHGDYDTLLTFSVCASWNGQAFKFPRRTSVLFLDCLGHNVGANIKIR
jgi:hypothetical protein